MIFFRGDNSGTFWQKLRKSLKVSDGGGRRSGETKIAGEGREFSRFCCCHFVTVFLAEICFRWRRRSVNWPTKMEGGKFISIVICCYCYFYFGIDVIGGQV